MDLADEQAYKIEDVRSLLDQLSAGAILAPTPRRTWRRTRQSVRLRAAPRWSDHVVLCHKHEHAASMVAVLEAHGIPVEWVGNIYSYPEVKDALAICATVRAPNNAGLLRALTIPEHALAAPDLTTLVQLMRQRKLALGRAVRDPDVLCQLSRAGQRTIATLQQTVNALAVEADAWRVLTRYVLEHSGEMRLRLARAASGDYVARRELATLGQLIVTARNFVRQAPPHERHAVDFVGYVRLLIESEETAKAQVLPGQADVVRVMTMHAAKGLEFPIVYIPNLQQEEFPGPKRGSVIPPVPAMYHGASSDDLQERRYLLYVAMTRSEDQLVLSWARIKGGKPAKRSCLLPGGAHGEEAPWLVSAQVGTGPCPEAAQPARLPHLPPDSRPVRESSIDTYERCPRKYMYQYGFQLYDDVSPNLRMHQTIRDGVRDLAVMAAAGTLPSDEQALNDWLWGIFARHEMAEVLYARDYFAEAFDHVRAVWQDLRRDTSLASDVNRHFEVVRPVARVDLRVDRVEETARGVRLVQMRTGRPKSEHHTATRMVLYALAYEQQYGGAPQLALQYTLLNQEEDVSIRHDVMERRTAKLDAMLAGITSGQWEPVRDDECITCAFNLICPV